MIRVLMFHSVGLEQSGWATNYLSIPIVHMEKLFHFLASNGYETPFLERWYELEDSLKLSDTKSVFLTFDDGYLDNWTYLFPLLGKYGLKATIFINPEFIDPSAAPRPNLDDVWQGKALQEELTASGYLNWQEIIQMQASGLVDIQSHSMSHNWYFTSERIVDFYARDDRNLYWLAWLARPDRKPFWMSEDQRGFIPNGTPIFENGRSLGIRRYFPDPALGAYSSGLFQGDSRPNKADALAKCYKFLAEKGSAGRCETDQEMLHRYVHELQGSKEILEAKLGKKVNFLCWPGGAYNDLSVSICKEVGYLASTVASRERHLRFDNSGVHKRIVRAGIGSAFSVRGRMINNNNPNALVRSFQELEGQWYWKYPRRFKKAFYYLRPRS